MKKLLSILLAVIMVFSTMTVVFSIPASAEVVSATAAAGGYIVENDDETITAVPYYGNTFNGWYVGDDCISASPNYTGEAVDGLTAKFNVYNAIADGNFEVGDSADKFTFNAVVSGT